MVQRRQQGGKESGSRKKCKSNLRSLPKKSYNEDRDTQSDKSRGDGYDDDDDDDDDFEPLKKHAMKSKKKKPFSKEDVDSKVKKAVTGLQENRELTNFPLNISKPNLSDSESSDEDIDNNALGLDHKGKMEINRLNNFEGMCPKKEITDSNFSKTAKNRTDQNDSSCASKELGMHNRISSPDENKMEVDDNVLLETPERYNLEYKQCSDHEISKGSRQPSHKGFYVNLAGEKCEKVHNVIDKNLTGKKKRGREMSESQEQKRTRMGGKRQMKGENEGEVKALNKNSKSKRAPKQPAKTSAKKKDRKMVGTGRNQEKSMQHLPGPSKGMSGSEYGDSDESENEWEDVNEAAVSKSLHESPRKKAKLDSDVKDISINLKVKSIHKPKGQKNKEKFLQYAERAMRKFQNQQQTNLHKCHLICLVARLLWLSKLCNHQTIKAICMSFIPSNFSTVSTGKWDLLHLRRFLNWSTTGIPDAEDVLATCKKISGGIRTLTRLQIFVASLRTIGLRTRLVISFQPITWKVDNSELFRLKTDDKKHVSEEKALSKSPVKRYEEGVGAQAEKKDRKNAKSPGLGLKSKSGKVVSPYFGNKSEEEIKKDLQKEEGKSKVKESKSIKKEQSLDGGKSSKRKLNANTKVKNLELEKEKKIKCNVNTSGRSVRRQRKPVNYVETAVENNQADISKNEDSHAEDDFDGNGNDFTDDDDDDFEETPRRSLSSKLSQKFKQDSDERPRKSCMPSVERGYARKLVNTIDDEVKFEKSSKPVKRRRSLNDRKHSPTVQVISSDSESSLGNEPSQEEIEENSYIDSWCEVYLKSVKRWVCINIVNGTVDDTKQCEKLATQPLQYVLGIDNQNAIKDVTCRYASKFMSKTRKLRIDREWWAQTLHPYETRQKKLDAEEDTQLKMFLMQQPFPNTQSEFKNHPLYVLEGDLLKFEALYPEQPAVLGYFRNKAIYSRECIHILHTRENWLKEARVVKQGETAYKIVKGRPKRSTPVHERDKVKIDLFGLWQTEIYKPPPIVNGKVPRNEYGNVELFQPSMLPPGGVHIPIQGIHRTARKLGIDAAPAMMGWDFHGGCAHPIIEGVVVAVEFEEKLLDAWQKDEDERERKLKEKNEKKILDRWKMLVKGLLVRERIRRKYDFREGEEFGHTAVPKEDTTSHVSVSWPLNKLEGKTSINHKGHCHIFPESSYKQDKISGEWTKSCSCGLSMPFEKL